MRFAGVSGSKAIRAFERAGYVASKPEGSHVKLKKPGYPNLVIPLHREVSPFLLRSQIKRAGLTEEEFRKLL
ncbi:MAG TPA: type II toxin-antitoxin system HicA family toxin [Terriglobia bacterium]|nr:type II toxin-antitoxin system HicA family toxin [Terriglobia bacterium]